MKIKEKDTPCKNCGEFFCTCEEDILLFNQNTVRCDVCNEPLFVDHTACEFKKDEEQRKRDYELFKIRKEIQQAMRKKFREQRNASRQT